MSIFADRSNLVEIIFTLLFFCVCAPAANAQAKAANSDLPVWQGYKGVAIGMLAADVRKKLGTPKSENDSDFFYIFSDSETVAILFDAGKKVTSISAMFTEEHENPPKFEDVFSKNVKAEPKADGAIFKRVNFPDAGYWVSFSRTAGEKAMVIIVISGNK